MWQNLLLAGIVGWVARGAVTPIRTRIRRGRGIVDAITNKTARDRRRVPDVTEMP